jgi:hypothetical protein
MGEEVTDVSDIDFEAVGEALERAGDDFSKKMLIDLLMGTLEALRSLSERVAVLEATSAKKYAPDPYKNPYNPPTAPWTSPYVQPYKVWNTAQAVLSADAWCD